MNFYQTPAQKIDFPDSGIILGNPEAEVTLYVFTDFLCSACYEFYRIETIPVRQVRQTGSGPCTTTSRSTRAATRT